MKFYWKTQDHEDQRKKKKKKPEYYHQNKCDKDSIAFTQVQAGNMSENLASEIRQIVYSLNREKKTSKKHTMI